MTGGGLAETSVCPQCGGHLAYDPATTALLCGHCRAQTAIPPPATATVEHLDFEAWAHADTGSAVALLEQLSFACDGCGATTTLPEGATTGRCPYCTRAFVAEGRSQRRIRPGAVLPMTIDRTAAAQHLQQWLGSRWFAPNDLKHAAKADAFGAVHVPAWSYSAQAATDYEGERGEDRTEHYTTTRTNDQGETETVHETRTVTDWYGASGHVEQAFVDVVVPASGTITQDEEQALRPFELERAVPFQPEYLLGSASESYSLTLPEGWTRAQALCDDDIEVAVNDDIGGDHQRIHRRHTTWSSVLFLHLLLPIWVAAYTYRGETYRVLVNGRTGQVHGRRPYSWVKIVLAALAVVAVIAAAVALYVATRSDAPR